MLWLLTCRSPGTPARHAGGPVGHSAALGECSSHEGTAAAPSHTPGTAVHSLVCWCSADRTNTKHRQVKYQQNKGSVGYKNVTVMPRH